MPDKEEYRIKLHIVCQYVPSELGEFGLQDKAKHLHLPITQNGTTWEFEALLRVAKNEKTGIPNFLGDFTHGTSDGRFLYLSLRERASTDDSWIRRIKIPLKSITWEQIQKLMQGEYQKLTITVNGTTAATVKDANWQLIND